MRYAKLVFALAVDGPFDYQIPEPLQKSIAVGKRVKVNFNHALCLGYVTGLCATTAIPATKPILEVIDDAPVLGAEMLKLTKKISEYYSCAWGEVISSALPAQLRKGKHIRPQNPPASPVLTAAPTAEPPALVLQASAHARRWDEYCAYIASAKDQGKSTLVIVPDVACAMSMKEMLLARHGIVAMAMFRGQAQEVAAWEFIRSAPQSVVIGTRSAVFAPVQNLGLIIVEEEQDTVYKQEQAPHYHARQVALMRAKDVHAGIILGTSAASLESYHLAHAYGRHRPTLAYRSLDADSPIPQVKAAFARELYSKRFSKGKILTYAVEDAIAKALSAKEKILLLVNRKGFSTFASCQACGAALQCPRCQVNLVYYFEEGKLRCNHCAFSMEKPPVCPACHTGQILFTGMGVEKVESELARMFAQARIKTVHSADQVKLSEADIIVSTSSILKKDQLFDLGVVLSVDSALNRNDFRASEKVFSMLASLRGMIKKQLMIQTMLGRHHVLDALVKNDAHLFYKKELELRAQLQFPPFWHLTALNIRGPGQEKVKDFAQSVFARLSESNTKKQVDLISVGEAPLPKLRGNFYYQILMKSARVASTAAFLKLHLKKIRQSGILISVDVDPL